MRKLLVGALVTAVISGGTAAASPGRYWLDICHAGVEHPAVGSVYVDEVVADNLHYDITCSVDAWVQGYGGSGEVAWLSIEAVARDENGDDVVRVEERVVRPTGARVVWDGANRTVIVTRDGYDATVPAQPRDERRPGSGLPSQNLYFHCATDDPLRKVDNLNGAEPTEGVAIGWDATAPSTSRTQGGGCATVDAGRAKGDQFADAHFAGTITGNIADLTVHANVLCADPFCRGLGQVPLDVALTIDGQRYTGFSESGGNVTVAPMAPLTQGVARLEFSIADIGLVGELHDGEHTVELVLSSYFGDSAEAWLYDATEFPSRIEVNPSLIAQATVSR